MELTVHDHRTAKILWINDYKPNQAMENEFQTRTFKFQIKSLELFKTILNEFVVENGAQFLLVNVRITNLSNEVLSIYDDDFTCVFDGQGPYACERYFGVPHQFEDEYALKPNESLQGCLVFIINQNSKKIEIEHQEYFDDESFGKTYRCKYIVES